jgi:type IV secretion system protein VirB9
VFRYPASEAGSHPAPAEPAPADAKLDGLRRVSNDDYWYCGSRSLRPVSAVDDGLQVRLTFAASAEMPAVYAAEPDGDEVLVNTHVENDTIIVHRLAARLVLRRGREVGCIVNRSAPAAGQRAASGTVDEGIDRQTREVVR